MKSRAYVIAEGTLYGIIAAGSPLVAFFASDQPITWRTATAAGIAALVAAANSIKAFLSQSMSEPPKP